MKRRIYYSAVLLIMSCSNAINIEDQMWSVNEDFIREGCFKGKDCIPSIDSPKFSTINGEDLGFLNEDDLVVGIWHNGNYLAFPHPILNWHEIVNGTGYTISYCPLTGSAINIDSNYEFGVSGLLYNSNLIMYDRESDSFWPQMLLKAASGEKFEDELYIKPLIETTWSNWKKLYPNSLVLNSNTGFNRDYTSYPYGEYKTCNSSACRDYIYFPIEYQDDRLPSKERVLTIINNNSAVAVRIKSNSSELLKFKINDVQYVAIVSEKDNVAISFKTDRELEIEKWNMNSGEIILSDKNSTDNWNLLGVNISDANSDNLEPANSYIAYWFSAATFFPDLQIIN